MKKAGTLIAVLAAKYRRLSGSERRRDEFRNSSKEQQHMDPY